MTQTKDTCQDRVSSTCHIHANCVRHDIIRVVALSIPYNTQLREAAQSCPHHTDSTHYIVHISYWDTQNRLQNGIKQSKPTCHVMHHQFNPLTPNDLYTECPRRNLPDFGRVFLMLNYTDITQNTYIQS